MCCRTSQTWTCIKTIAWCHGDRPLTLWDQSTNPWPPTALIFAYTSAEGSSLHVWQYEHASWRGTELMCRETIWRIVSFFQYPTLRGEALSHSLTLFPLVIPTLTIEDNKSCFPMGSGKQMWPWSKSRGVQGSFTRKEVPQDIIGTSYTSSTEQTLAVFPLSFFYQFA